MDPAPLPRSLRSATALVLLAAMSLSVAGCMRPVRRTVGAATTAAKLTVKTTKLSVKTTKFAVKTAKGGVKLTGKAIDLVTPDGPIDGPVADAVTD